MRCAANNCCRKSYKKHKCTDKYSRGIYCIVYWRLQRKIIDNVNKLNDTSQTLKFYAVESGIIISDATQRSVASCIDGIKSARCHINQEIFSQMNVKEQYQHNLTSDIIDRKYQQISTSDYLTDEFQCEDFIDRKFKHISEASARRNLFTMLKFNIKGCVDPYSINQNDLA
jgi:hypothetical protein